MFAHSPPGEFFEKGARKREIPVRATGRRLLFGLAFASLGCSIGFGLATSWGRVWDSHTTRDCVAHFDLPRPLFELDEARVVTVTAPAPAASVVSPPQTEGVEEPLLLNGPPTAAFKGRRMSSRVQSDLLNESADNLRREVQYITTWPGSGWSELGSIYIHRVLTFRTANDVLLYVRSFHFMLLLPILFRAR